MLITFISDVDIQSDGFYLSWRAVPKLEEQLNQTICPRETDGCFSVTHGIRGTVYSPGIENAQPYPNEAACTWIITVPENMVSLLWMNHVINLSVNVNGYLS